MENNIIHMILHSILILVYLFIGINSFVVGKKIIENTWLAKRRRISLFMITGISMLFILADTLMILKIEETLIWFFFHLSMAVVYRQFYETIDGDNDHIIS